MHKVCKARYPAVEINKEHSDFIYTYEVPCDGSASLRYFDEPCSASDWRTHTVVCSHTGNVIDYIKSVKCDGSTVAEYKDTTCDGTIAPITTKVTFDPVLSGLSSTTMDVQVYTDIASTLNSVSYEDTTGKYTFLGWNTDRNATSALTSLQISQNTTLYAIWKLNRHKIKFNTGFSDITQADRTLDFGSAYGELPNLVKTGYTFRGWYNGNTPVSSSTKMGDSDVTLTAKWDRKTYKLSYNVNGGKESYATKDILYLDKLGILPTPTRTGYTFKGWYNGSTKVSEDTQMPAENVELNASWQIGKYTLSYVTGFDNLTQNDKVLDYDTAYGSLPELSEEGYTFLGWYTKADGGTKVTADDKISDANVKIYAHWKVNKYTLSYDTNTTESVYGVTKVDFKSSNTLPVPTKKGYTFLGWYDGSTLIGSVSGGKYTPKDYVMPAKDVTLTGKWSINSYNLIFNTGFEDIKKDNKVIKYNEKYGELPVLTRDGYTFHGWKNSDGETVNADTIISDSDVQLTADWSINSYKVTFNSNGGKESYDEKTVKYLDTLGVLPVPTKVGHTFEGWFNGDEKVSEDTVMSFKDMSLVAKWSVNKYTLSFNTGFEELKENSKSVAYDTAFGELPVLTREGYTFNGWVDSEGAKVSDTNKMPASDVKLTAVWTINQYKVSLDTNGGIESYDERSYDYNSLLNDLPTPTKKGYTFLGWFNGDTKVEKDYRLGAKDINLRAEWSINSYRLNYETDCDTTIESKMLEFGSAIGELPILSKIGHTFINWVTSEGTEVDKDTTISDSDMTIFAKWLVNKYTVSFNSDGGTPIEPKEVNFGDKYGKLDKPTKHGYSFVGWYNGEDAVDESTVMGDSNVNLTAKWSIADWCKFQQDYEDVANKENKDVDYDKLKEMLDAYNKLPEESKKELPQDLVSKVEDKQNYKSYLDTKKDTAGWGKDLGSMTDKELTDLIESYDKLPDEVKNKFSDEEKKKVEDAKLIVEVNNFNTANGGTLGKDPKDCTEEELRKAVSDYSNLSEGAKNNSGAGDKIEEIKKYLEYIDFIKEVKGKTSEGISNSNIDDLRGFIGSYNKLPEEIKKNFTDADKKLMNDIKDYLDYTDFMKADEFEKNNTSFTRDEINKYDNLPDAIKDKLSKEYRDKMEDAKANLESKDFIDKWKEIIDKITNGDKSGLTLAPLKEFKKEYDSLDDKTKEKISSEKNGDTPMSKIVKEIIELADEKVPLSASTNTSKLNSSKTITKDTIEVVKVKKTKKAYKFTVKTKKKSGKFMIQFGKKKNKLKKKYYVKSNNKAYKKIKKGKYKSKVYKGIKVSKYKNGKYVVTIKKSVLNGGKYIKFSKYTINKKKLKVLLKGTTKKFK